jgi:hypothetical protein
MLWKDGWVSFSSASGISLFKFQEENFGSQFPIHEVRAVLAQIASAVHLFRFTAVLLNRFH